MLTAICVPVVSKVMWYLTEHKEVCDTPPSLSLSSPVLLAFFIVLFFYRNDLHVCLCPVPDMLMVGETEERQMCLGPRSSGLYVSHVKHHEGRTRGAPEGHRSKHLVWNCPSLPGSQHTFVSVFRDIFTYLWPLGRKEPSNYLV